MCVFFTAEESLLSTCSSLPTFTSSFLSYFFFSLHSLVSSFCSTALFPFWSNQVFSFAQWQWAELIKDVANNGSTLDHPHSRSAPQNNHPRGKKTNSLSFHLYSFYTFSNRLERVFFEGKPKTSEISFARKRNCLNSYIQSSEAQWSVRVRRLNMHK